MRRVAEHSFRTRLLGPRRRVRVDLHGVSIFGPGPDEHTLIRWERIEEVTAGPGGVDVIAATATVTLPPGSFGVSSQDLADELQRAATHEQRGDVIARLAGDEGGPG